MKKLLKGITIVAFLFTATFTNAEFIVQSYQTIKNKRVVRQNYEESCGASPLATLLNILDNRNLTELEVLRVMNEKINTDMVSFTELKIALQELGFVANSYALNRETLDKLIKIPLIVKIEDDPRFPHFVVIINHKGNYLQILDPSYGEYISSKREFYSIWDKNHKGGYSLIVLPQKSLREFTLELPKKEDFEKNPFKIF